MLDLGREQRLPLHLAERLHVDQVLGAHLHHLNPFPENTGDVLRSFDRVLVAEMNTGQLSQLLRAKYLVDVESFCKVQGQPRFAAEIEHEIAERQCAR